MRASSPRYDDQGVLCFRRKNTRMRCLPERSGLIHVSYSTQNSLESNGAMSSSRSSMARTRIQGPPGSAAMRKSGRPVVGVRSDLRAGGDDSKGAVNLMLAQSCADLVTLPAGKRTDEAWLVDRILEAVKRARK